MITSAHHTMLSAHCPKVFNYIAVKIIAAKATQGSRYGTMINNNVYISIGDIQFINPLDEIYPFPSTTTVTAYSCFDRTRFVSDSIVLTNSAYNNLFLGTPPTNSSQTLSLFLTQCIGYKANVSSVFYYETGKILAYKKAQSVSLGPFFKGNKNAAIGCSLVLNVSQSPLDISTYSRWRFYNPALAESGYTYSRFWAEGEILGSVDGVTWYRMDRFNDPTVGGGTAFGLSRTAKLIPIQGGNLFQDIDYMDRDWETGIKV